MGRDVDFSEEDKWLAGISTSLTAEEEQVETSMTCYFTHIRVATIKNTGIDKYWREPPCPAGGNINGCGHYGKQYSSSSENSK